MCLIIWRARGGELHFALIMNSRCIEFQIDASSKRAAATTSQGHAPLIIHTHYSIQLRVLPPETRPCSLPSALRHSTPFRSHRIALGQNGANAVKPPVM